jgi:hypothetical protein
MNSALGAAIEISVVESLNELREMWDPQQQYADFSFVRQSQRFPDVLLRTDNPAPAHDSILMGIELKGWFLLSKEGEPSFRYKINPACCAEADLLVVVPWVFDSVVSGAPKLLSPIIVEARYAALRRDYHWRYERANPSNQTQDERGIKQAQHIGVYPPKTAQSSDSAISDSGSNFGRVVRCGVMDNEVNERMSENLLGVPIDAWRKFIKIFADGASASAVAGGLQSLERAFESAKLSSDLRAQTADLLNQIASNLRSR